MEKKDDVGLEDNVAVLFESPLKLIMSFKVLTCMQKKDYAGALEKAQLGINDNVTLFLYKQYSAQERSKQYYNTRTPLLFNDALGRT